MSIEVVDGNLVIDNVIVIIEHISITDDPIKSGNSGVVLFGRDSILNRKVVIKFWRAKNPNDVRPKDVQGRLEARKCAQLNNHYFAQIFSASYLNEYFYVIQEYIDGVTLKDWLAKKPDMSARTWIWNEIVKAVKFLHQQKVYHGDLHSKNILIIDDGVKLPTIKIIDFGTSQLNGDISYSRIRESKVFWETAFKIFPEYKKYQNLMIRDKKLPPEYIVAGLDNFIEMLNTLFEREAELDYDDVRDKLMNMIMRVSTAPLFHLNEVIRLVEQYLEKIEVEERSEAKRFFLNNLTMFFEMELNGGRGSNHKYINLQESDLLIVINSLYQECRVKYLASIVLPKIDSATGIRRVLKLSSD